MQGWKMQDWNLADQIAGLQNAIWSAKFQSCIFSRPVKVHYDDMLYRIMSGDSE